MKTDKTIVITGANGQLGESLTREFIKSGMNVIALDISRDTRFEKIEGANYLFCDVRKRDNVDEVFSQINSEFGPIAALINNAGTAFFTHYSQRKDSEISEMFDVNLRGPINCTLSLIESLNGKKGSISIVNIASLYGIVSPDFRIYGSLDRRSPETYGATKAGVIQLTKYFAVALADLGIRVNSVSPGGIYNDRDPQDDEFVRRYSERTLLKRMARVDEIVKPVLFLVSDASSYITGHNLVVDGGYSAL